MSGRGPQPAREAAGEAVSKDLLAVGHTFRGSGGGNSDGSAAHCRTGGSDRVRRQGAAGRGAPPLHCIVQSPGAKYKPSFVILTTASDAEITKTALRLDPEISLNGAVTRNLSMYTASCSVLLHVFADAAPGEVHSKGSLYHCPCRRTAMRRRRESQPGRRRPSAPRRRARRPPLPPLPPQHRKSKQLRRMWPWSLHMWMRRLLAARQLPTESLRRLSRLRMWQQ